MRSAVRLFCFLIGMGFQQIPPLLLLVNLLFVLLLVSVFGLPVFSGVGVFGLPVFSGFMCVRFAR